MSCFKNFIYKKKYDLSANMSPSCFQAQFKPFHYKYMTRLNLALHMVILSLDNKFQHYLSQIPQMVAMETNPYFVALSTSTIIFINFNIEISNNFLQFD